METPVKLPIDFAQLRTHFIELNELAEVAKELGRPLDAAELEECIKDLDTNKDNQISLDEFRKWWLSGRQGLSPILRRLLAFKIRTNKFFGTIQGTLGDVLKNLPLRKLLFGTAVGLVATAVVGAVAAVGKAMAAVGAASAAVAVCTKP